MSRTKKKSKKAKEGQGQGIALTAEHPSGLRYLIVINVHDLGMVGTDDFRETRKLNELTHECIKALGAFVHLQDIKVVR